MARFSEAWNELLHPRDRLGRFRSKWSLKGAKKAQVDGILDRFEPRTFTDPNRAARYGIDESAGQTPLQKRSIRDYITRNFRAFNAELEQGKTSPETDAIDSAMKPLRDDLVLTRSTGPEAFGLNPNDAQAIEELTGKLIASDTYTPTWLAGGTNNGGIVMHILAPKGTPAIFPGGAEVTIARGQPFRVTKVEKDPATGRMRMFAIALPKGSENGERVETNLPGAVRAGREEANVEAMQRSTRFPDQPAVPIETIPEPLPPSTEPAPERLAPNPRAGEIQPPKAAPSITGDTPGGVEEDGRPSWTSGNNPIEVQAPGGGAGLRVTAGNKVVVPDSADMEVLAVNAARAGLPEVAEWAKANQRRVKMSDAPASAQRAAKRAVAARDLRANEEPDAPEASAPKAATPSAPETAAATPAPPASTQAAPQAAPTLEAPQAARAPGATQAVPAAPEVPEAAPQVVPAAPEVPEAAPQAVPAPEAPQVVPQAIPAPRAAPAPEAPRAVPEAAAPALPVARTEPAPEAVPEAAPGVPEAAPSLLSGPEAVPPVATQLPTVAPIPASVPLIQPVIPETALPSAPEVPTPAQVDITQPVPANATPEYRAAHFKALQEAARAARAQQDENQTPRADEETAKPEPVVVAPVKKVVKKAAAKKAAPAAAESAPEAAEQIPLAKSTARAVRKTTPAQLRDRADAAGIDVPASARTKPEILDAIVKGVLERQGVEKPEAKKAQPTKITARKIAKTPTETPEDREKKVIEAATTKQVGPARKIAKPAAETPQARWKALSDQQGQEAVDDRLNSEQRKRWADALGGEPKNLTAGDVLLDEMADELRNGRITRAKAATRLREHTRDDDTPEAHYLRKVADLIESDTSKPAKRVPRTKRPARPAPDVEAVETSLTGRTERNIQTGMNNLNVAELRALADKWGIETRGDDKKLKLKSVLSKELAAKWKATPELQRKKEDDEAPEVAAKKAAAPEVAAKKALRQPAKKAAAPEVAAKKAAAPEVAAKKAAVPEVAAKKAAAPEVAATKEAAAESSPADELDGMSKVQLLQYARDNDLKVPVSKSVAETRQHVKRARDAKENSRKLVETAKGSVKAVEPEPEAPQQPIKKTTQRVSPKRLTGSEIVDSSPEEIAQAHSEGRVSSTLAVRRIRQDAAASKTSASFIGLGKPDKELDRSQLQDRQAHLKRAAELDALADRIQGTPRKRASKKAAPSVESIAPEVKTETVDAETAQIPEAPVEVKAPPVAKKATPKKMTVRDIASASPEDLVRGVDDGHVSHARAIQELQIRNSSLTDDVTRGDLTDDPERSATRDELKRNQEALKELRGAPAAKKVQAKKAAPSPVDLAGAESREQAEKMLTDLSAEQLREISREMGIPPQSRATKEKLRRDIVDNAVGMRIDANAIMGRAPEEREANRQQGAKKARARMAETSPAVSPAKTVKTTVLSKATKKAAGPAAPVPPSTPLPSAPAKVVSPAIKKEAKDAAASEDAAPKVATSTGGPIVPGPPVKGAGNSVTTSRGEIVSRNRPKADEPIFLPNGGLDQGLIHLDSELGSLWADLYVDDREPNSFINEIARMGDAMGMGQLGLSDFIARLKEMKKKATDKAVADRIQSAIDRVDAPPVKLDIPDDTPPRLRQAFEELAAIPTARKSGPVRMGTTLLRAGDPSVLDRKQDILRRLISGSDPELLHLDAVTRELRKRDLHESTDAATTMWSIFDTALKDPAVEKWLNDKARAGRLKSQEASNTPSTPSAPPPATPLSPALVETPPVQRHTRSQLMALNPGELKEIEDELGITKRPSLDRGDRADAILKAEAAQAARKAASSNK